MEDYDVYAGDERVGRVFFHTDDLPRIIGIKNNINLGEVDWHDVEERVKKECPRATLELSFLIKMMMLWMMKYKTSNLYLRRRDQNE